MKVTDLMIGDWVEPTQCIIPTVYCRVEGIYPDGTISLDKAERTFTLDEIKPVSIFREILLDNGFEESFRNILTSNGFKELPVYKYKNTKQAKDIHRYRIKVCESTDRYRYDVEFGIGSRIFNLEYVHELQHALKLCGIDKEIIL